MTVFYGDYLCPVCNKVEKLLHEELDGKIKMIFPGEAFSNEKTFIAECGYCNEKSNALLKVNDGYFIGFLNEAEKEKELSKEIPDTNDIFNKWKNEKTFSPFERVDFKKQPFKVGQEVKLGDNAFVVRKIYRTEWVEKNLDIRLELPRPDTYWYEIKDQSNTIKWLKVENVEGENIFLSENGIIIQDNSEVVEEITDNPTKIKKIYSTEWFGGREIEVFQYVNGTRILVYNHKKQIEMDVFEDTFEEAMGTVEDNMELGVFNE